MNTNPAVNRWPTFLVSLVLAFLAISWWSLDRAASRVSPVSDPDYYHHGLQYNTTNLNIQAAQTLGWTITPEVQGRLLTIKVADASQTGIPGCQGAITIQTSASAHSPQPPLALTDSGHGLYTVDIPPTLPLTLSAHLTLSKDQVNLQRQLLINLDP